MTASSRPDMTLEDIAERWGRAVVAHAASLTALRDAARELDADAPAEAVLSQARYLGMLAGRVDKAAASIRGWEDQLRRSLNGAYADGVLTAEECGAILPGYGVEPAIERWREQKAATA